MLKNIDIANKHSASAHIGIIADIPHAQSEQSLESLIKIASDQPDCRFRPTITADSLLATHSCTAIHPQLIEKLNRGYDVVAALIGIPGASHYTRDIHNLLDAWAQAQRPVLLIATPDQQAARTAINGWPGWQNLSLRTVQPVELLQQAVQVNREYLLAQSGEKLLAQLEDCAAISQQLKPLLNPREKPVFSVIRPSITPHQPQLSLSA